MALGKECPHHRLRALKITIEETPPNWWPDWRHYGPVMALFCGGRERCCGA